MTKIISIIDVKGGAGKSITGLALQKKLLQDGFTVELLNEGVLELVSSADKLNTDYVIIDASPGFTFSEKLKEWVQASDMLITPVSESTFVVKTLDSTLQKMTELKAEAQKAIVYTGNRNSTLFQDIKSKVNQKLAGTNTIEVDLFAPMLLDENWSNQEIQEQISDYVVKEMDQELRALLHHK
ncbi:hypothetical protein [Listeria booriae]|uniref:ParA family protein n=1 Tax=Listeria booriae TaxID=1552123 RepID=A0A842A4B3_9LIST|nr:hypothetical protein [Listeria booriae]MBC1567200.1 ParA family protein [Listeria booriae]